MKDEYLSWRIVQYNIDYILYVDSKADNNR